MKSRRVGTVSMGIVLIMFGLLLLLSRISAISAVELFIYFWPLIIIILGIEILYYVYKNKDEQKIIRYDILSIFIVAIILIFNMAIYGLIETGVIDLIKYKVAQEMYYEREYNKNIY